MAPATRHSGPTSLPVSVTLPRGIYCYEPLEGARMYFAIQSDGSDLSGVHIADCGQTDLEVIGRLSRELNAKDRVRHLQLLRDDEPDDVPIIVTHASFPASQLSSRPGTSRDR
jgi:hypothetical protein